MKNSKFNFKKTRLRLVLLLAFSLAVSLPAVCQSFTSLEDALQNPAAVKELKLKRKRLREVPEDIALLKNLEVLNLSHNKIEEIPQFLGKLQNLHTIILSKNQLVRFPKSLGRIDSLRILILDRNNINSIPSSIQNFSNLSHLDLWDNTVSYVDAEITSLSNLKTLDLRNTYFKTDDLKWLREAMPDLDLLSTFGCNCN